MRLRPFALSALVLAVAAGVAGCSTSDALPSASTASAAGATPGASAPGAAAGGGSAPGTMTVRSGGKVVCVITFTAGKGKCTVNTAQFTAGTVKFTGTYNGGTGSKTSTSTASMQLMKAPTGTTLSLTSGTAKYGSEQAERLTVRVVPKFSGVAAGTVTVRAGSAVVCVITLASGAGSCALTAGRLAPGSYRLIASYPGSTDFTASASQKQSLSVSK